ncbi:MAG: hypothetical protein IBX47_08840 [Desulfuromonadales bacterium]|nr:hypothetical protein [Desulfuromonadales bacterium]
MAPDSSQGPFLFAKSANFRGRHVTRRAKRPAQSHPQSNAKSNNKAGADSDSSRRLPSANSVRFSGGAICFLLIWFDQVSCINCPVALHEKKMIAKCLKPVNGPSSIKENSDKRL